MTNWNKDTRRPYLGIKSDGKRIVFRATRYQVSGMRLRREYDILYGPFKTTRAAKYMKEFGETLAPITINEAEKRAAQRMWDEGI